MTNRQPKEEFAEDVLLKENVHLVRMEEVIENDIEELTLQMFDKTYNTLKKKPGKKYNFIIKRWNSHEGSPT